MSGQHTPGSWAISGVAECGGDISISAGRFVVATAHNGVSFSDVIHARSPEQQWANARLIAAAPELLAALVEMEREKSDYMLRNHLGNPAKEHTNKMARAAIAKATGGQA